MNTYCMECLWFCYLDSTCGINKKPLKQTDNCYVPFPSSLLFKNNCVTCKYSRRIYKENPDNLLVPESRVYQCAIKKEEYPEFHLPDECQDFEIRPFLKEERKIYLIRDFLHKCKMGSRFNQVQLGGNYDDL